MSEDLTVYESTGEVVISTGAIESITRGEIDVQIATAHRFPRSIQRFLDEAKSMATIDEDTSASCFYKLPRGGKTIEGPSIRLAEIAKTAYGNIRTAARIVAEDSTTVTAQGVCHDLERNIATSVEITRRITDKYGKRFNDDMIAVTKNAACAIAQRNAIYAVVPRVYINSILKEAKKVAVGDASTLNDRRYKMLDYFTKMGVTEMQILAVTDHKGIEDIDLDDLELLTGIKTAIKDGFTTVDEVFNQQPEDSGKSNTERLADIIAGHQKEQIKKPETPAEEPKTESKLPEWEPPSADDKPKTKGKKKDAEPEPETEELFK